MKIIADTHTHTVACDHAYSTLLENVAAAREQGLRFLAATEHAPGIPGAPTILYFNNLRVIPEVIDGVAILKGTEVNILDKEGSFDLPEKILGRLDWVIASFHGPTFAPQTRREHTQAWMAVAENPLVDVIGHAGDPRYDFEYRPVIRAFRAHGKIVEINAHSFVARPGSGENCPQIARICAEEGVPVLVNSDAHYAGQVGRVEKAVRMLEEIGFPEELVLNVDYDRFLAVAREKACGATKAYLDSL